MSAKSVRAFLTWQMGHVYRSLRKAVEGLSEAQAFEGARLDWRQYRWGTGLDGSIAGIVHHAALWKHVFAAGLTQGVFPGEDEVSPPGKDWPTLLAWLEEGQARLAGAVASLPEGALNEIREWEGMRESLVRLLSFMVEHDIYHAGQVELLRQLRGYPRRED
jgi:uncharacterized damage-inducible protein DinB